MGLLAAKATERLYSFHQANWKENKLAILFLSLSAIGLLICIYAGASAMLFWMPDSWDVGEEYDAMPLRVLLASFVLLLGVPLVFSFEDAIKNAKLEEQLQLENHGLRAIINRSGDPSSLETLKNEFQRKQKGWIEANPSTFYPRLVSEKAAVYEILIFLTDCQKAKADSQAELCDDLISLIENQKLTAPPEADRAYDELISRVREKAGSHRQEDDSSA